MTDKTLARPVLSDYLDDLEREIRNGGAVDMARARVTIFVTVARGLIEAERDELRAAIAAMPSHAEAVALDEFGDPHGLPWSVRPWGDGTTTTGNSNIVSNRWEVVIATEMPTETAEFIVESVNRRAAIAAISSRAEVLDEAIRRLDTRRQMFLGRGDARGNTMAATVSEDLEIIRALATKENDNG